MNNFRHSLYSGGPRDQIFGSGRQGQGVCVCVSVRSFLPPRASRRRNIGTYVFTATRKTLLYIIIVIFAENASFRSYGRRHLLASNATNYS